MHNGDPAKYVEEAAESISAPLFEELTKVLSWSSTLQTDWHDSKTETFSNLFPSFAEQAMELLLYNTVESTRASSIRLRRFTLLGRAICRLKQNSFATASSDLAEVVNTCQ